MKLFKRSEPPMAPDGACESQVLTVDGFVVLRIDHGERQPGENIVWLPDHAEVIARALLDAVSFLRAKKGRNVINSQ